MANAPLPTTAADLLEALFPALPDHPGLGALALSPDGAVLACSGSCRELLGGVPEPVGRSLAELLEKPGEVLAGSEGGGWLRPRGAPGRKLRAFWSRRGGAVALLLLEAESPAADALARFASMVTHEMRNPLSSVKMIVQTLERHGGLDARDQRRLTIASREIRSMERILSAVADLARPIPARPGRTELGALGEEVRRLSEPELRGRGLALEVRIPAGLPELEFESARLEAAIAQVVAAAAQAGGQGPLWLEAWGEPGALGLCVGNPAPPNAFRVSGAGLALAMAEKVAFEHGGSFRIEAGPEGSRLRFRFPLAS